VEASAAKYKLPEHCTDKNTAGGTTRGDAEFDAHYGCMRRPASDNQRFDSEFKPHI
jgi:hypothetical protein